MELCTQDISKQEEEWAGLPCFPCVLTEFINENCGLGHESVAVTEVVRHVGFSVFGNV